MSKRGAVTSCKGNSSFCGFLVISVPALPIFNIIPPRHFNLQAMVPRALPPSGSSGGAAVLKETVLTVISRTFTFTKMVQLPLPSAVPSWSQSDSLLRVGPWGWTRQLTLLFSYQHCHSLPVLPGCGIQSPVSPSSNSLKAGVFFYFLWTRKLRPWDSQSCG